MNWKKTIGIIAGIIALIAIIILSSNLYKLFPESNAELLTTTPALGVTAPVNETEALTNEAESTPTVTTQPAMHSYTVR